MRPEASAIIDRYSRRVRTYSSLSADVCLRRQELERAIVRLMKELRIRDVSNLRLLDLGCGNGDNLLQLLRLGFEAKNMTGVELIEDRAIKAKARLPAEIRIHCCDALDMPESGGGFDIVFQSLVFSSILDDSYQEELARRMWAATKPGGGILWYDFMYNNPRNADVRGVTRKRINELFGNTAPRFRRITLAPPISRAVTGIHPFLYGVFNCAPILRTHYFGWIPKPK